MEHNFGRKYQNLPQNVKLWWPLSISSIVSELNCRKLFCLIMQWVKMSLKNSANFCSLKRNRQGLFISKVVIDLICCCIIGFGWFIVKNNNGFLFDFILFSRLQKLLRFIHPQSWKRCYWSIDQPHCCTSWHVVSLQWTLPLWIIMSSLYYTLNTHFLCIWNVF